MRHTLRIVVGLLAIFCVNLYAVEYTLPTDGWYQLQNPSGVTLCQTGDITPCDVEPGVFILINHTIGLRNENFRISAPTDSSDCPSAILANLNTILGQNNDTGVRATDEGFCEIQLFQSDHPIWIVFATHFPLPPTRRPPPWEVDGFISISDERFTINEFVTRAQLKDCNARANWSTTGGCDHLFEDVP